MRDIVVKSFHRGPVTSLVASWSTCIQSTSASVHSAAGRCLQLGQIWVQVDGSERDDVMRRALEIVAAAPQDEARRMAHIVMSSVDQHDHDRFAEQFVELNLALGNRDAALAAIVNASLAEQRRGSYKACS